MIHLTIKERHEPETYLYIDLSSFIGTYWDDDNKQIQTQTNKQTKSKAARQNYCELIHPRGSNSLPWYLLCAMHAYYRFDYNKNVIDIKA